MQYIMVREWIDFNLLKLDVS